MDFGGQLSRRTAMPAVRCGAARRRHEARHRHRPSEGATASVDPDAVSIPSRPNKTPKAPGWAISGALEMSDPSSLGSAPVETARKRGVGGTWPCR